MERVRKVKNLTEYFKDSVAESMDRQQLNADDHTACYVVNLLTLFSRSEDFFDQSENGLELKPVALVLADAVDRDPDEKNFALQRVGDVSLFVAGFLGDGLAGKLVGVECDSEAYHTEMRRFHWDRERRNRLELEGWAIRSFTWHQVRDRPDWVVDVVRRSLDQA